MLTFPVPNSHWIPFNPSYPPYPALNNPHITPRGGDPAWAAITPLNSVHELDRAISATEAWLLQLRRQKVSNPLNAVHELDRAISATEVCLFELRRQKVSNLEALGGEPYVFNKLKQAGQLQLPPVHQIRHPASKDYIYALPPAPRLNNNLPLPNVDGQYDDEPKLIVKQEPAVYVGLHLEGAVVRSHGTVERVEPFILRAGTEYVEASAVHANNTIGSSIACVHVADSAATDAVASHVASRKVGSASPPLRVITSYDLAALSRIDLRQRSVSSSASTEKAEKVYTSKAPELTLQTSGFGDHADDDDGGATTPGLSRSASNATSVSSSSSQGSFTFESTPSVLFPPLPESPLPRKRASPKHNKNCNQSTPTFGSSSPKHTFTIDTGVHDEYLNPEMPQDERCAFRTSLPLSFNHVPSSGYHIKADDGTPIGWSAGPEGLVQSLAGSVRHGKASPKSSKGKSKRVIGDEAELDPKETEEETELDEDTLKAMNEAKEKADAKGKALALLTPRTAMKNAKKAKLDA